MIRGLVQWVVGLVEAAFNSVEAALNKSPPPPPPLEAVTKSVKRPQAPQDPHH